VATTTTWTVEAIESIYEQVSNWGRWGPDDELGALNFITQEKVREASSLVRKGRLISIGRDLSTEKSPLNPKPIVLKIADSTFGPHSHGASCDLTTHNHGPQTHVDPTSHVFHKGKVYPGKNWEDVITREGLTFGSMYAKREGIVTRGVLLDIPRARGVDYLDPSDTITAEDLAEAERISGVEVTSGDAICIRAGFAAYQKATGIYEIKPRTGLGPDCAVWIHDKEVAVVSNECPEKLPSICPEVGLVWHIAGLVYLAVTFVESPDLDKLKQVCEEEGTNEFMFIVAPQRIPGGTGNLVNPLVCF